MVLCGVGVKELGLPDKIQLIPPPDPFIGGYSTDVGEVSLVAPTATITVPTWPVGIPLHSWALCAFAPTSVAHKGMLAAAKSLVYTAIDILNNPELIKNIREEFVNLQKNYPYISYLPKNYKPPLDLYKREMDKYRPMMEQYYMDKDL